MRARAIAIFAALGVLAALALPAGVLAKPGYYKTRGFTTEQFHLHASDGYSMRVAVSNGSVQVFFDKHVPHGMLSFDYFMRGRQPAGPDLHFPIGHDGAVNLRFVPHGQPEETTLPNCTGGAQVVEVGALVGSIRFRGRAGFTRVDAHRVPVVLARVAPMTCRKVKTPDNLLTVGIPAHGGKVPENFVRLIVGDRPGGPIFAADLFEEEEGVVGGQEPPDFSASISRHEGGAEVSSAADITGRPNTFGVPESLDPPAMAPVEPPAPFSGSATFQFTSLHHAEWSGDLAVVLPGYGRVPLTGPQVRAGLCRGETCTPTLPKFLRPSR